MARGKCEVLWGQEGLPYPRSRAQGTWEPGLVTQGWGMLHRGRLVVEGPGSACGVPSLGPKLASPGSDKSHLLGASPCSSIRKGGSLYGWKNRGIFGVVVTGPWCRRVCLHVGRILAPPPHVSEPLGGTGPFISGCRCPAVVKEWRGHCTGERGHLDHERAPEKFPSPGHHGSRCFPRLLPWGLMLLNWARVRHR